MTKTRSNSARLLALSLGGALLGFWATDEYGAAQPSDAALAVQALTAVTDGAQVRWLMSGSDCIRDSLQTGYPACGRAHRRWSAEELREIRRTIHATDTAMIACASVSRPRRIGGTYLLAVTTITRDVEPGFSSGISGLANELVRVSIRRWRGTRVSVSRDPRDSLYADIAAVRSEADCNGSP
jgi:hypothetical protein